MRTPTATGRTSRTSRARKTASGVDYADIPKDMEHAAVAIEDKRFYKHKGVDWYRTTGAFINMFLSMKNDFGGSTITQQLIKNPHQAGRYHRAAQAARDLPGARIREVL